MVDFRISNTNKANGNFFKKVSVSRTTFGDPNDGYRPDCFINFNTYGVILLNEETAGVVEYSFNGFDVHGELDPTKPSKGMTFDNRVVNKIWLRVKSGSSGTLVVRVDGWG